MKLLKGIGALFVKLWRWIKETAWVQPLLIVGAIFAIIFSIPYFTKWVESLSNSTSNAFYSKYQVSLNKSSASEDSDADKLIDSLYANSYFAQTNFDAVNDKATVDANNKYEEKFFVIFVSETCNDCNEFQPALELLQNRWNQDYIDCFYGNDEKTACPLAIHTIFADEDSDIDDDDENEYNEQTIFERFLDDHNDFFEQAQGRLEDKTTTPYTKNASVSEEKFKSFGPQSANADFPVPTILLVDYTKEAFEAGRPGVSEVLFGVSGSTKYDKASLLLDMWNHLDNNTSTNVTNKFSANYSK